MQSEISLSNDEVFDDGIDILWGVIAPCNLRCGYCYFGDPNNHFTWTTRTAVRKDDIFQFANNLEGTDVKRVFIAGGDPTQLNFLPDLIQTISQQGIDTAISTNGVLMNEELTIKLAEAGLNTVFFSIDSPTSAYHDIKRGKWAESVAGLRTAIRLRINRDYDYNVGVYMVVTKENVHMLPEMVEFVKNEGADYVEYQPVSLSPDHDLYNFLDFTTSPEDTAEFISKIQTVKNYEGLTMPTKIYRQILYEVLIHNTITVRNCFGGKSLFFIDPLGDVWPCPSGRRKNKEDYMGNIITTSSEDLHELLTLSGQGGLGKACSKCDRDCVCMFELTTSDIWQK